MSGRGVPLGGWKVTTTDQGRPAGWMGHHIERTRVAGPQRHPQPGHGPVEQGLIRDAASVVREFLAAAETSADVDGLVAIGLPRDPDRSVSLDEHGPMLAARLVRPPGRSHEPTHESADHEPDPRGGVPALPPAAADTSGAVDTVA